MLLRHTPTVACASCAQNDAWEHQRNQSRWLRHYPLFYPGTTRKRVWDRILSISIMFHLLSNPLVLAFSDRLTITLPFVLLFASDFVYWLDIVFTFATAIEERSASAAHTSIIIKRPKQLASRYLHGAFMLDFIASIPYWWLVCFTSECAPLPAGAC